MQALSLLLIITITIAAAHSATLALTPSSSSSPNSKWKNYEHKNYHDFCILGGGPAGIQTAYFMHRYKMDYVVFERDTEGPGSFFKKYPRQRNLISINKVHTGTNDTEFNLRHDWNSLLSGSDDFFFPAAGDHRNEEKGEEKNYPRILFKSVSKKYYPTADTIPKYLDMFIAAHPDLHLVFGVEVQRVMRERETATKTKKTNKNKKKKSSSSSPLFHLFLSTGKTVRCRAVILATGKAVEKQFRLKEGNEFITSYTDAPTDSEKYQNQDVLILGGGNSAFELAKSIESHSALVHIASRNPIEIAAHTHYVGDVRAVNLGFLDRYQLKSMDVLLATPTDDIRKERVYFDNETQRIYMRNAESVQEGEGDGENEGEQQQQQQQDQHGSTLQQQQHQLSYSSYENDGDGKRQQKQLKRRGGAAADDEDDDDGRTEHQRKEEELAREALMEISPMRRGYHRIIACVGFRWNSTPFLFPTPSSSSSPPPKIKKTKKLLQHLEPVHPVTDPGDTYLEIASNFESVNVPDLFVVGALAHYRDFKRSAGGFIHGFRYTVRTTTAMLRERYLHQSKEKHRRQQEDDDDDDKNNNNCEYPFLRFTSKEQVLQRLLFRLKNVSSLYQMQSQLCDAILEVEVAANDEKNKNKKVEYHYFQDLPLDMVKSKYPKLVSINAFKKKKKLHFLTLSLEFGKDFQGVGTIYHQGQKETFRRRASKMLWNPASKTSDPDYRLQLHRAAILRQRKEKMNNKDDDEDEEGEAHQADQEDEEEKGATISFTLPKQERVKDTHLLEQDEKFLQQHTQQQDGAHQQQETSIDLVNLLHPLSPPPTMLPAKDGRPPRLDRFLFLHPVVREWKRTSPSVSKNNGDQEEEEEEDPSSLLVPVKNQLVREVRLHEDVLNDFTGKHYHETPLRKLLEKAFA